MAAGWIVMVLGVFLGLVLLMVVLLAVGLALSVRPGPAGSEERAVRWVRGVGLLLGLGAATWVVLEPTPLDRGLGSAAVVAPLVLGITVLLAVVVGELLVRPRVSGGTRTASLRPRSVRDQLPARLTRLVLATGVASLLLAVWTTLVASDDDMGRAGRSLAAACSPVESSSRGPFPGIFYTGPWFVGVALATLVALVAAHRIAHRTLGGTPEQAQRYRRVGLTAVVGALGVAVTAPMAGMAFFAGTALLQHSCPQTGWRVAGVASLVVLVCCVGTLLVSLVSVLSPGALAQAEQSREPHRV